MGSGVDQPGQSRPVRRSKRLGLAVPVFVFGRSVSSETFSESTRMLSVNACGGALALGVRVEKGQSILLVNRMTHEDQECRVADVGPLQGGKWAIGIEFAAPAMDFWRIHFPPPGAIATQPRKSGADRRPLC
jgi:hypothetical protein